LFRYRHGGLSCIMGLDREGGFRRFVCVWAATCQFHSASSGPTELNCPFPEQSLESGVYGTLLNSGWCQGAAGYRDGGLTRQTARANNSNFFLERANGRDEMNVLPCARVFKLFLHQRKPPSPLAHQEKSNRAGFFHLLDLQVLALTSSRLTLLTSLRAPSCKMCFPFSQNDYELEPTLMTRRVRTHRTTRKTRCSRRVSVVTTVESVPLEYLWSVEGGYWVLHTKVRRTGFPFALFCCCCLLGWAAALHLVQCIMGLGQRCHQKLPFLPSSLPVNSNSPLDKILPENSGWQDQLARQLPAQQK